VGEGGAQRRMRGELKTPLVGEGAASRRMRGELKTPLVGEGAASRRMRGFKKLDFFKYQRTIGTAKSEGIG
jgi:hypothetical protein